MLNLFNYNNICQVSIFLKQISTCTDTGKICKKYKKCICFVSSYICIYMYACIYYFQVTSVSFSADGSYFVTVGMRHVKFWYLDSSKSRVGPCKSL